NLETVLKLGGANNLTIQEYKQRQELALANLSKAKEWWLPDVYAGIQTNQLWGASMNSDGRFFLDVSSSNLWLGLGLEAHWDFAGGIYEIKAARLKAEAVLYQTQAERNKALLESIDAYYDFAAAQMYYLAYQQLAAYADTISRQIDIQVQSGLLYGSEFLLSKSSINHLKIQMLNAKVENGKKSAALVKLLDLDPNLKLVNVDSALSPLNLLTQNTLMAAGIEIDSAYQNRPEFTAMEINYKSLEIEKKTITTGLLIPELWLNTYGSYFGELSGQVRPMNPIKYPETKQLYSTGALNVSLMWKIPLGRLIYAGDLKQFNSNILIAKTQMEQLRTQVNEEIISAREALIAAKEQMEIAFEGSQFAGEALQQSIQRQEFGTVRPFEILQVQEMFIKIRLDYIKAVSDYNKAQYALLVAIGEDL
ncbi:MAG: TolC family protein, partial [Cyclobacteriaceae bacterium]|nr:TolC family protein [Cyclobacteriaceae bacterium]